MSWQLLLIAIGLIVLLMLVWRRPALALYTLVGAAVTFEIFPLGFSDSLTDTIPFFLNLNNSAGLGVSFSPAEVVMVLAIAAWIAGSRGQRAAYRPSHRILRAYLAFMVVVLFAEAHGIMNGGDFNISLWELRPQVYGFILFVLTASLIRERRQVVWIAAVFIACVAFKAGVGYNRYFFVLHQSLGATEAILSHEDSYFLLLFLAAVVAAAIWVRRWKIVLPMLLTSPIVGIVMLENRRRVAMVALWAALAVVIGLSIRFEPALRKRIIVLTAIGVLGFAGFVIANWNNDNDNIVGQIVRPVHTITGRVSERDYLSDIYRTNENADILYTYHTDPLIGIGFGLPMLVVFPLADISQQYPLWQFIPHNTDLWVAMRMGILGMAAFWGLTCVVILEGVRSVSRQTDPFLRAAGALALAAVIAELVVGYGDVQLENYRNMIFFGTMIGLIDALPKVRVSAVEQEVPVRHWASVPAFSMSSHGQS